jgi:uncharacterized protein YbbK (DUF523 family)
LTIKNFISGCCAARLFEVTGKDMTPDFRATARELVEMIDSTLAKIDEGK